MFSKVLVAVAVALATVAPASALALPYGSASGPLAGGCTLLPSGTWDCSDDDWGTVSNPALDAARDVYSDASFAAMSAGCTRRNARDAHGSGVDSLLDAAAEMANDLLNAVTNTDTVCDELNAAVVAAQAQIDAAKAGAGHVTASLAVVGAAVVALLL